MSVGEGPSVAGGLSNATGGSEPAAVFRGLDGLGLGGLFSGAFLTIGALPSHLSGGLCVLYLDIQMPQAMNVSAAQTYREMELTIAKYKLLEVGKIIFAFFQRLLNHQEGHWMTCDVTFQNDN